MILFTILLGVFILLMVITVVAFIAGGAAFVIVFGDVIVCILLIGWILKHLIKRKK